MDLEIAKNEALILMNKHGLSDKGWRFEFDNAKRRFGVCNYTYKRIGLSKHLTALNEIEQVINTILHEIAHALVGNAHGHDSVWRAKAMEIGCTGDRCYSHKDTIRVVGNYIAVCPECKHEHYKFKMPKRQKYCGVCSRIISPSRLLVYKPINK